MTKSELATELVGMLAEQFVRLKSENQRLTDEIEALRAQIARMRAEWTRQTLGDTADRPVDDPFDTEIA